MHSKVYMSMHVRQLQVLRNVGGGKGGHDGGDVAGHEDPPHAQSTGTEHGEVGAHLDLVAHAWSTSNGGPSGDRPRLDHPSQVRAQGSPSLMPLGGGPGARKAVSLLGGQTPQSQSIVVELKLVILFLTAGFTDECAERVGKGSTTFRCPETTLACGRAWRPPL